jgi:dipeptidyl-peptidase-4
MKKIIFCIPVLIISFICLAQDKLLTLEDALVKNRTTLAPANLKQLQFVYNTGDYVYLGKQIDKDTWIKANFTTSSESPFLTLQQLNTKLKAGDMDTLTVMPAIQFNQSSSWIMTVNGNKIALDPVTNKITTIIPKSLSSRENIEESNAGYLAYLEKANLFIRHGSNAEQITTDGSRDIVYASSVHREEFGIVKGTFWSSSGTKLAFYRMDQSMVTDYPIIDWTQQPAVNVNTKYPMAGGVSHQVTIGVYAAGKPGIVYLKTGEPVDQYLTNIAWSPDEKFIYVAVLNRGQDHMKMNKYDASTGQWMKTLFEEKDDKYVEPLVPMLFLKNDPSKFIWQSNRDGWNHLYLYDTSGKMLGQLTKGDWEVVDVKGLDSKGENLFFVSTQVSPLTRNLYALNLKTGKSRRITTGDKEVHATQVSTDGKYVIDSYHYLDNPRTIQLIDITTGKTKPLFQAPNPLAEYALGQLSVFPIQGPDNTTLYCRLYKPLHFDSTKKYPVIVYWYGGSHVQLVGNGWNGNASDYWFQYMAERGYLVFSLDTRGSDNRGKAFEQSMFRELGKPQMEDMMAGVNWLRSKPWVDAGNMGLFGWSFGGFMTTDFMVSHPGIFKAAVAGGPVMDWSYYEIMYTERYMDTPKENPGGYANTDLSRKADQLKGKLLLVHGLQDNVVVQQHSVRFVRAAIDKNVQVDYMIYPGHEHNVLGKDRTHLFQKISDYFDQYIKPGKLGF